MTEIAFKAHLAKAEEILTAAKAAGGRLTDRQRADVHHHIAGAQDAKDWITIGEQVDSMRASANLGNPVGGHAAKGLGSRLIGAGFDIKQNPSVTISAFEALVKAPTLPGSTLVSPKPEVLVPMGRDQRYLWPNLARENAGFDTAVSDFKQTVRTVTGGVERAIDATTDKAELDVTITHVVEAMKQLAVTVSNIPNAILEAQPTFRAFFDQEGLHQVEKALDTHALNQIIASAPPFGNTGSGLVQQVRNAVTSMRDLGANPDLLVLNAADAASLDLTADAGGYVFPLRDTGASPLWGLRVVERPGTTPPYVIDTQMLGVLYLGTMRFDADPYTGFKKNLTTLRVETSALFHVRNANGARRIAAA